MSTTNTEDIYQLSPIQQGMLFHTLHLPGSGMYIEQRSCTLQGPLDVPAFEQAWQRVVGKHPVLRTSFIWDDFDKPLQVVHKQVRFALERQDWRGPSREEQEQRLSAFLQADRRCGFDLSAAPLMRVSLFQIADDAHYFIWTNHHIVLDGWSRALILKEFLSLYEANRRNQTLQLEDRRPYRDYIAWLRRRNLADAEAFWRPRLDGFTQPTQLPIELNPDGSSVGDEGYFENELRFSKETTAALHSFAKQNRLTLNTLIQGAWALLLSRYSDREDVVFGATISGRPAALTGAESMVGVFINTLPVRARIPANARLLPWLKALHAQQQEILQYDYSPLVEVHGWSNVPRKLPLFESIVVFENYPIDETSRGRSLGFEIRDVRSSGKSNYPMALVVAPGPELTSQVIHHSRRYERESVGRMLGHLKTLLEGFVGQPEGQLCQTVLLTDQEERQIVVEWNRTSGEEGLRGCVHEVFEDEAANVRDGIAVVYEEEQISYGELNRRANRVGWYLRRQGVGPEDLVGIYMERGVEMMVGVLGVMKAGGGYVPLDVSYPRKRVEMMVKDSGAKVLLMGGGLEEKLELEGVIEASIDEERGLISMESGHEVESGVKAQNVAYVIYTSGSTGLPKGVAISHRGLRNLVQVQSKTFRVETGSRVLQFASLSFDTSAAQIFMALTAGATLVVVNGSRVVSGRELVHLLREQAITSADLPPSALSELPEADLPSLHTISTGGERCRKELVDRWSPGRRFFNVYGPTETTICASLMRCAESQGVDPPIGRRIANTRIYLLDRHLRPVPKRVPGEIYIGGIGLARGYLNRPEMSAERFIPDALGKQPGMRLYRTGDLARYREDGNIEFIGRVDHQVKVRGYRIELGEVETVLEQHEAVKQAVVVAREDSSGDKRLVAYVVPKPDGVLNKSRLRAFLKERLPDFMTPAVFVSLDALPLTAGGKTDLGALPEPGADRPESDAAFVAPQTELERAIAATWQQVLQVDRVGLHDNFFDLGGHSLLMIRVQNKLREVLSRDMSILELFEHTTVSSLAGFISRNGIEPPSLEQNQERAETRRELMRRQRKLRQEYQGRRKTDNIGGSKV